MTSYSSDAGNTRPPRIVVIGGGTGVFTALSGLRKYPVDLTAIVSMADDGGSSGVLREEFGILPPGDVRRALVALSRADNATLSQLFNYRFEEGGLSGHSFGNIMLAALDRITGSFESAIEHAAQILSVRGAVLPVTLNNIRLYAELEDGAVVRGESNIDIPKHDGNVKIIRVWLEPEASINMKAKLAIRNADLVIIGPGDLYTSIIPNLLVKGVPEILRETRAKKVYVVNIMTKWGETNGFTAGDFVRTVEHYLGSEVLDCVVVNTKQPSETQLQEYAKERAEFVTWSGIPSSLEVVSADLIRRQQFLRHDPHRLAEIIMGLLDITPAWKIPRLLETEEA